MNTDASDSGNGGGNDVEQLPVRLIKVEADTENQALAEARKQLFSGERVVDIQRTEKKGTGLFEVSKGPSRYLVTVVGPGESAPYEPQVLEALQDAVLFSNDGVKLKGPLPGIQNYGSVLDEVCRIAEGFLHEKGATRVNGRQLEKALSARKECTLLVGTSDGMLEVTKKNECTLVTVIPAGPGGQPVDRGRLKAAVPHVPALILDLLIAPARSVGKVSLACSGEFPPITVSWGLDGVTFSALEAVPSALRKRCLEYTIKVLDYCRISGGGLVAVKKVLYAGEPSSGIIAHRQGTAVVDVSGNEMEAFVTVQAPNGGNPMVRNQLNELLTEAGISHGVDEKQVKTALSPEGWGKRIRIAAARAPQKGEPVRWEIPFANRVDPSHTARIDHHTFFSRPSVDEGTVLARKIPAGPGIDGYTVTGLKVPAEPGEDVGMNAGEGTELIDSDKIVAAIAGRPELEKNTVSIIEILTVGGDVDYGCGNIDFHGDVHIVGSVLDGFEVKSQNNVFITGTIGNARIEAGGDVSVGSGIIGHGRGFVRSGGDVSAKFIENATVVAITKRGSLIGGRISARESIRAKALGAPGCPKTLVQAGGDPFLMFEYEQLREKLKNLKEGYMEESSDTASLEERLLQYHKEKEKLEDKLADLEEDIEEAFSETCGEIEVIKTIYPCVTIRIGPHSVLVKRSIDGPSFDFESEIHPDR